MAWVKVEKENVKYLTCPFCGETDFDAYGLKIHFYCFCPAWDNIPTNGYNNWIPDETTHMPEM